MKWANILRYRTVRCIHAMILGAALIGPVSKSLAQPPQASAANIPMQNYTRSLSFHLPVSIDAETRSTLAAIQLYVKTPTGPWKMQQSGPPSLTRFNCRVQQEGEYWYSLVMVDKAGRKTPADVAHAAPLQRIVVDTTPPVIQVQPVTSPDGEYCLRCTLQDANPDPLTWRAVCKTDAGDVPLEILPNYPGVFRVKGAEPMKFPVAISAADLAKNVGTREVNVRDLIQAALYPESAPVQQGPEIPPASAVPPSTAAPQPARPDGPTAAQPSPGPKLDIGLKNDVAPALHRSASHGFRARQIRPLQERSSQRHCRLLPMTSKSCGHKERRPKWRDAPPARFNCLTRGRRTSSTASTRSARAALAESRST